MGVVALAWFEGAEQPSWLQARIRYVYVVLALSPVSTKETLFAATVATSWKARPAVERSISKRVSFVLVSLQERSRRERETAVASRPVGAEGTAAPVRALATFENGPSPPELKARTRKKYVVSGARPRIVASVVVPARRPSDVQPRPSSERWIS